MNSIYWSNAEHKMGRAERQIAELSIADWCGEVADEYDKAKAADELVTLKEGDRIVNEETGEDGIVVGQKNTYVGYTTVDTKEFRVAPRISVRLVKVATDKPLPEKLNDWLLDANKVKAFEENRYFKG